MNYLFNIYIFSILMVILQEIFIIIINLYKDLGNLTWKITKFRIFILFSYFFILGLLLYIGINRIGQERNINNIFIYYINKIKYIYLEFGIINFILFVIIIFSIIIIFYIFFGLYVKMIKISIQSLYYYISLYDNIFKYFFILKKKSHKLNKIFFKKFCKIIEFFNISIENDRIFKFFNYFGIPSGYIFSLILKILVYLPIIISINIIIYDYIIYEKIILYHYYYIVIYYPIYNLIINLLVFLIVDDYYYINSLLIKSIIYKEEEYKEIIERDKLEIWKLVKNVRKGPEFREIYGAFYSINFLEKENK